MNSLCQKSPKITARAHYSLISSGTRIMDERGARRDPDADLDPVPVPVPTHRVTNFYIETILRPDFGIRGTKTGTGTRVRDSGTRVLDSGTRVRDLNPGTKSCSKDPQQGGAPEDRGDTGTSEHLQPGEEARNPATVAGKGRGDARSRSPPAGSAPASRPMLWPAWVYCTRYSDRPSAGPRSRRPKKTSSTSSSSSSSSTSSSSSREEKRPRTAFTPEQLQRLRAEFQTHRYLTESRRRGLARDLDLNESQIKIWFQNKRAKIKKASGGSLRDSLKVHLMAQGLYNHGGARDPKSDSD